MAASLRHMHLLHFKHIKLGLREPLARWTWLKYPKDQDPFAYHPVEMVGKAAHLERAHLFMVGRRRKISGACACIKASLRGCIWRGELMVCWQRKPLGFDQGFCWYSSRGTCRGVCCRAALVGTAAFRIICHWFSALPQLLYKVLSSWKVSGGKFRMKKGAYSMEIPAAEFSVFLLGCCRWGHLLLPVLISCWGTAQPASLYIGGQGPCCWIVTIYIISTVCRCAIIYCCFSPSFFLQFFNDVATNRDSWIREEDWFGLFPLRRVKQGSPLSI